METASTTKQTTISDGVQLAVTDDRLSVRLTCPAEFVGIAGIVDEIKARLGEMKVTSPIHEEQLLQELERAKTLAVAIESFVIAEGAAPVPSVNGSLEWSKNYFEVGYYVDPKTNLIDYHRRAAAPQVAKDELIVLVHPPKQGKDGADVFGKAIPTEKPKGAEIKAGLHVFMDEKAGGFRADCGGRVKFNGKVLEVHDNYEISGNVGPDTGNIDHNGSVVVKGGVDAEFRVVAKGDIEVAELIGAADIECGGNLTASNGIRSTHGKKVVVKGILHAKYLEYATIISEGDIVVETEIFDSIIRTTGQVICMGRVQGGDVMAAGGIRVGEAGSKAETTTVLTAGTDYRIVNALRAANEKSKQLKEENAKFSGELKRLQMLGSSKNHKQIEKLTELEFRAFEIAEELAQLLERRKMLAVKLAVHSDASIIIEKLLNPGTVLRVLDAQLDVRQALLGPLAAKHDPITKELALSSTDITTKE